MSGKEGQCSRKARHRVAVGLTGLPSVRDTAEARAQQGWDKLGRTLRTVAPHDLGRLLVAGAIGVATIWLVIASWPALLPFTLGAFVAYTLLPVVNLLNRLLPRPIATLLSLVAFAVVGIAMLTVMVPALAAQVTRLYQNVLTPDHISSWRDQVAHYLESQPEPLRTFLRSYVDQSSRPLARRSTPF